jgi:hypothetical protein
MKNEYSNERILLFSKIVDNLAKHYELALPCNSEHDRSSYAMYKDNMGIDDRLEL